MVCFWVVIEIEREVSRVCIYFVDFMRFFYSLNVGWGVRKREELKKILKFLV